MINSSDVETRQRSSAALFAELAEAIDHFDGLSASTAAVPDDDAPSVSSTIRELHRSNAVQWAYEDDARRPGATDAEVGTAKRLIDRSNARRHRLIEAIDSHFAGVLPEHAGAEPQTETIGMVVDRMSILALRAAHLAGREETDDVPRAVLESVRQQRDELGAAFNALVRRCLAGTARFGRYRAYKIYGES